MRASIYIHACMYNIYVYVSPLHAATPASHTASPQHKHKHKHKHKHFNISDSLALVGRSKTVETRSFAMAAIWGLGSIFVTVECSQQVRVRILQGSENKIDIEDITCEVPRMSRFGFGESKAAD